MSQFTGNLFLEQLLNTCVQMPIPGIVAGSPLKQVRTQRPEGRLVSSTRLTTSSDFSGTSARETTDPQGQTWVQIFPEILLKVSLACYSDNPRSFRRVGCCDRQPETSLQHRVTGKALDYKLGRKRMGDMFQILTLLLIGCYDLGQVTPCSVSPSAKWE